MQYDGSYVLCSLFLAKTRVIYFLNALLVVSGLSIL